MAMGFVTYCVGNGKTPFSNGKTPFSNGKTLCFQMMPNSHDITALTHRVRDIFNKV
jgi:hypothetical protein